MRNPGFKMQDPGFKMQDPRVSKCETPVFEVQERPWFPVQDPGFKMQNPGFKMQTPVSKCKTPVSKCKTLARPRFQNAKPRFQNAKPRVLKCKTPVFPERRTPLSDRSHPQPSLPDESGLGCGTFMAWWQGGRGSRPHRARMRVSNFESSVRSSLRSCGSWHTRATRHVPPHETAASAASALSVHVCRQELVAERILLHTTLARLGAPRPPPSRVRAHGKRESSSIERCGARAGLVGARPATRDGGLGGFRLDRGLFKPCVTRGTSSWNLPRSAPERAIDGGR
jgi:hypothetical protein